MTAVPIVPAEERPAPDLSLEAAKRRAVVRALALTGGNKRRAARLLGIQRPTLYSMLRRYRLDIETITRLTQTEAL